MRLWELPTLLIIETKSSCPQMEEQAGETSKLLLVRHSVLTKASEQPIRLDSGGGGREGVVMAVREVTGLNPKRALCEG